MQGDRIYPYNSVVYTMILSALVGLLDMYIIN
jgi:hypothetical protein